MAVHGPSGQSDSGAPESFARPAPSAANEPQLTRWQKFRMVVKVVELRLRFIALMAATGLVFAYWDTLWNHYEKWSRPPGETHAAASDTEHYCPMHPTVIQAEPGSCPICGMPLSKRKKGEKETLPAGVLARVSLAPFRVAQAGVRTSEVNYAPLSETMTTVGTIEVDERLLKRISSKTKGMARVDRLLVNFTGTKVKAGEPLAEVYSPELYQAIQELLLNQSSMRKQSPMQTTLGRSVLGDPGELVRLSGEKLKLWGITQAQVDQILREGKADFRLPILAPIGGVVIRKNVIEGEYVSEGQALFEIADLTHVWVKAQVFENQFSLVRVGQSVEATVEAYPGEVFSGKVAFIDPVLNSETRTVTVRYDLENADLRLRPGMFATVTLKTPVADTPAFRSRIVSRPALGTARRASLTVDEQKVCLVTHAKLGSMGTPIPIELQGQKLWMCCEGCEEKLKGEPVKYLARLAPAPRDEVLTVPESAVIDTGTKKVVYVETDPGVFEGREVVLGPISGDRYPVLDGLSPGESVATSGSFLIDAENRLNPKAAVKPIAAATQSAAAPATPVHRH
ncbi:efflux RND transporter periplasmic adaptor subunit [Singulisphaera acidiphila]|uniref:Membrane-fusion protein n=1 Tax=Singulisphaera acidiphila (strain ATCC BAA-1392 / DSM 18658 / VKM B-2454 / MOB10) TaxID=886293 RepID=L0DDC3_SINAD|nr:efflux RND transporter periplasmic adaptor subunit [Singulisphaera acidiphila]AGA26833.1 membrane-fusion protein [Singulisphaera acidiphila DSM 18658]